MPKKITCHTDIQTHIYAYTHQWRSTNHLYSRLVYRVNAIVFVVLIIKIHWMSSFCIFVYFEKYTISYSKTASSVSQPAVNRWTNEYKKEQHYLTHSHTNTT